MGYGGREVGGSNDENGEGGGGSGCVEVDSVCLLDIGQVFALRTRKQVLKLLAVSVVRWGRNFLRRCCRRLHCDSTPELDSVRVELKCELVSKTNCYARRRSCPTWIINLRFSI